MRLVWISAVKELKLLRRDPAAVFLWLAIPLVMGLLIHLVFGKGEVAPQGRLLLADEDNTVASNLLTAPFNRPPLGKMLILESVDRSVGLDRIGRGDASAFLLIPQGLQAAYLRNESFRIQLYTNPEQRVLPRIAEESLSTIVDGGFFLRRLLGTGENPLTGLARAGALARNLNPPLIRLQFETVDPKGQRPNIAVIFFPTMVFMALLLMANGLSAEIWREHSVGTARRLATTPGSFAAVLAGRVIAVALLYGVVGCAGVAATRWLGGPSVVHLVAAAAWAMLAGTVFYLLLLPVSLHASRERGADLLGSLIAFPLALLGGCFFPFEMMPKWMAAIGRVTPNGWAITQFRSILGGSAEVRTLAIGGAWMIAAGAIGFVLSVRRLGGAFLR